jgi:hypothetical protein
VVDGKVPVVVLVRFGCAGSLVRVVAFGLWVVGLESWQLRLVKAYPSGPSFSLLLLALQPCRLGKVSSWL